MIDRDNEGQPGEEGLRQLRELPRKGVDPVVTVSYFGPDGLALDRLPKHRDPQDRQSAAGAPTDRHCAAPETSILFIGSNGEALDKLPS